MKTFCNADKNPNETGQYVWGHKEQFNNLRILWKLLLVSETDFNELLIFYQIYSEIKI